MPDFAVKTAFTATDRISPAFKNMSTAADKFAAHGTAAIEKVSSMKAKLMGGLGFAAGFFGIGAIAGLAEEGIQFASDLQEVQNVVDTTFKSQSATINQWSKNALDKFGLTELQAKKFSSVIGSMMESSGISGDKLAQMSTDLAGLAGEFASFHNLPLEEAFTKIRAGLSGETEPLKQIGKDMSVAGLKAFAMAQGIRKNVDSMSMAEKYQLRFNYLMSQSKKEIGDFSKTAATSYSNQKRVFEGVKAQFLGEIMVKVLPSLTEKFKKLSDRIREIDTDKLANGLEMVFNAVAFGTKVFLAYKAALVSVYLWQGAVAAVGWISYLSEMAPIIMKAVRAQGLFTTMLKGTALWEGILTAKAMALTVANAALAAVQWVLNLAMWASPITWIILGLVALIAIGVLVYKNWDLIKEKFSAAMTYMWEGLKSLGRGIMTVLLFPINLIITGITKLLELASSIPGVGSKFAAAAIKAKEFQASMNSSVGATNVFAPNAAAVQAGGNQTTVNVNNATPGTTAQVTPKAAATVNMQRVGANP